ncbi:DUF2141 domain-containing protein [Pedobacter sp. MW01-1-1]|uniref:DUF2141 domain-containing protein n=1 Tax=Pedobacter sp. MW01-1-1 TaxID=3383027 RepID=UPI003FF0355D
MKTIGLSIAFFLSMFSSQPKPNFVLKINNVKKKAAIKIAFYKKENQFLNVKESVYSKEYLPTSTGEITLRFTDIPTGEYALAIYQDVNGNNKLDKSLIGSPKEPFGFSQNFKPKFSAPDFEDCKISFTSEKNSFTIKLID